MGESTVLIPWAALIDPAVLATVTHFERPYTARLWSALCDQADPGDFLRTRNAALVTCPRCLYHGDRQRYQALQGGRDPAAPAASRPARARRCR
jgi:hypothetical protein